MAAPVVAGTVALMLQANPNLTPNLIKAILQYTAQKYPGYNALTQGAGFLNAHGAVRLARYYATATAGAALSDAAVWSKQIIWGNHRLTGGVIKPNGNAWAPQHRVGRGETKGDGDNIVWGTVYGNGDNIVWGTSTACDNIVWGTSTRRQHRLGHASGRRQHRLGHARRRRQHRLGHRLRRRRLRQHRVGHGSATATTSSGARRSDGDNIVWGTATTATTSCGGLRTARTRPGAAAARMPSCFDVPNADPISFDRSRSTCYSPPERCRSTPPPPAPAPSLGGTVTGLIGGLLGGGL